MDISTRTTAERIDMIVRQFVNPEADGRAIAAETNLRELGLTSLDMVNLMLAIEADFDLTIPGSKLIPANFRSIGNIHALVIELTT